MINGMASRVREDDFTLRTSSWGCSSPKQLLQNIFWKSVGNLEMAVPTSWNIKQSWRKKCNNNYCELPTYPVMDLTTQSWKCQGPNKSEVTNFCSWNVIINDRYSRENEDNIHFLQHYKTTKSRWYNIPYRLIHKSLSCNCFFSSMSYYSFIAEKTEKNVALWTDHAQTILAPFFANRVFFSFFMYGVFL